MFRLLNGTKSADDWPYLSCRGNAAEKTEAENRVVDSDGLPVALSLLSSLSFFFNKSLAFGWSSRYTCAYASRQEWVYSFRFRRCLHPSLVHLAAHDLITIKMLWITGQSLGSNGFLSRSLILTPLFPNSPSGAFFSNASPSAHGVLLHSSFCIFSIDTSQLACYTYSHSDDRKVINGILSYGFKKP